MVVELGPEVSAWATYPGGQSGNPLSARYRDRIPLWVNGELEPVHFPRTRDALDVKQRSAELTLLPPR
jgi:acyl-homoserine lactone acylase PvdQ